MSSPIQEFANNLKIIRKGHGLTQTQLAEKVGLTKQSIINYEKGLTFPTGSRLRNLLDVLNVNTQQLLGNELGQATSEKVLLEECSNKAKFWADYDRLHKQDDDEATRKLLIDKLSEFDNDTLFQAITQIYDNRIYSAHEKYTNELRDSILYPNRGLNIDIWVKQDDDPE